MRKFITDILAKANLGVEQNAYVLGTVGIGTSSPSSPLTINNATSAKLEITGGTNQNGILLNAVGLTHQFYIGAGINLLVGGGAASDRGVLLGYDVTNARAAVMYDGNGDTRFNVGPSSESMRITSGGNVGIGTTSPSDLLEVVGNIRANISNGGGFMLTGASTSGLVRAGATGLALRTNTTDRLTVDNSGNVGIGTTSPSLESGGIGLDILNSSYTQLRVRSSSSSAGIEMTPGAGKRWEIQANTSSNWFVYDRTDQLYRLLINGDGYVGIGTTSPSAKLDVITSVFSYAASPLKGTGMNLVGAAGTGVGGGDGAASGVLNIIDNAAMGANNGGTITLGGNYIASGNAYSLTYAGIKGGKENGTDYNSAGYLALYTTPSGVSPAERMRITSTGNVGIGTSTPGQKLTVAGSGNTYIQVNNGSANAYFGRISDAGTIQSDDDITFRPSSTEVMRLTNGKVGIGTTSPQTFLTLNGANVSYAGQLQIASNNFAQISFYNSAALTPGASNRKSSIIYNIGSNTFELANQITSGALVLQGSDSGGGNVGIGTDNPGYKLDVNGMVFSNNQLKAITPSGGVSGYFTDAVNSTLQIKHASGYLQFLNGSNIAWLKEDGNGAVTFSSSVTAGELIRARSFSFGIGGFRLANDPTAGSRNWVLGNDSQVFGDFGIHQSTTQTGSTYTIPFYINPTGNVGIGTTSPGEKLTVNGTIGYQYSGTQTWHTYANSANSWELVRSGIATRMLVTSDGNVGIGTTSPSGKLHVVEADGQFTTYDANGYSRFTAVDASAQLGLFRSGSTAGGVYIGANGNSFQIYKSDFSSTLLTILQASGNVGIGTTSPGYKLDVVGEARFGSNYKAIIGNDGTYGAYSTIGFGGTSNGYNRVFGQDGTADGLYLASATGRGISFRVNGGTTDNMFINSSGNVGIGTTSPGYTLDVNGNGRFSNGIVSERTADALSGQFLRSTINGSSVVNNGIIVGKATSSNNAASIVYTHTSDGSTSNRLGFGFWGSDNLLNLTAAGNVGIGTPSPATKLQVVGGYISAKDNSAYGGAFMEGDNGITYFGSLGTDNISLYSSGTRLFINGTSGNVGIGTASPSAPLHVYRSVGAGDYVAYIQNTGAGNGLKIYNADWDVSDYLLYATNGGTAANGYSFVVDGNGKVGIGTTSPGTKLEVNGGSIGNNIVRFTTGGSGGGTRGLSVYSNDSQVKLQVTDNAGSVGTWAFLNLNPDGGNVGIGTTSPSHKLHVVGNSAISNNNSLFVLDTAGNNGFQITNTSSNVALIYQQNNNILKYRAGFSSNSNNAHVFTVGADTEVVRFTNSGNVGIGTTAPIGLLHLYKAAATTRMVMDGDAGQSKIITYRTAGLQRFGLYVNNTAESGANAGSDFAVRAYSDAGTLLSTPLFIRRSTGNVGIGTTSPGYALDVIARASGEGGVRFWNNRAASSTVDSVAIHLNVSNTAGMTGGKIVVAENTNDAWPTNMQFYINSAGSSYSPVEAMRITSGGNVGIGTTSPKVNLDVAGAGGKIGITNTGTTNYSELMFYEGSTVKAEVFVNGSSQTGYAGANSMNIWQGSNAAMAFYTNATECMRITSGGDVLVGTTTSIFTSPNRGVVQVNGNLTAIFALSTGATDSGYLYHTGTDMLVWNTKAGYVAIGTNNSEKMRVTSGGNVGIGTTSPAYKLHVNGGPINIVNGYSEPTSEDGYRLKFADNGGINNDSGIGLSGSLGDESLWINKGSANGNIRFMFGTLGEKVRFTSSGNVGVGTTSPGAKLHLSGSGNTEAVIDASASGSAILSMLNTTGGNGVIGYSSGALRFGTVTGANAAGLSEKMRITPGGSVGIGTASPSYNLHVEGNTSGISIYASHDIAAFSDITVKKEVKRIENAIDKVKELNGYTYVRTDDETGTRRAGVIAQEVQKVLPEVVSANPDGTLNVAYSNMIALLIEGMKEQQKEIDELKKLLKK